ncbi:MAG: hypothetical protein O3A88_07280, partial [Proteobacteria bacterium]|nr:hypothetical protein [Pseudomonadota bacterium]
MGSPGKKTSAPESTVEQPLYAAGQVVCVAVPVPAGRGYDYRVPQGLVLAAGDLVRVPLGGREAVGVVWGKGGGDVAPARLRDVAGAIDCPPMTDEMRRFIAWVADYTVSPLGAVLRMALSVPAAFDPSPARTLY